MILRCAHKGQFFSFSSLPRISFAIDARRVSFFTLIRLPCVSYFVDGVWFVTVCISQFIVSIFLFCTCYFFRCCCCWWCLSLLSDVYRNFVAGVVTHPVSFFSSIPLSSFAFVLFSTVTIYKSIRTNGIIKSFSGTTIHCLMEGTERINSSLPWWKRDNDAMKPSKENNNNNWCEKIIIMRRITHLHISILFIRCGGGGIFVIFTALLQKLFDQMDFSSQTANGIQSSL